MKVIVDGIGKKAKEAAKKVVSKALDEMHKDIGPVQVVFHIFDLEKGAITEQHELPNKVKAKAFAMDNLFREGLTGITFYYPPEHQIPAEHYKVDYLEGGLRGLTLVIPHPDLFEKGGEANA